MTTTSAVAMVAARAAAANVVFSDRPIWLWMRASPAGVFWRRTLPPSLASVATTPVGWLEHLAVLSESELPNVWYYRPIGDLIQLGPQQPDRTEHVPALERPDDNSRLAPRQPRSDGCVEDTTCRTDSVGSINPVALKVKEHDPSSILVSVARITRAEGRAARSHLRRLPGMATPDTYLTLTLARKHTDLPLPCCASFRSGDEVYVSMS